jgi:hypothetical protein
LITENCDLYLKAPTHQAKKDVCEEILKTMSGRFLRSVSSAWVEISEEAARIKVAQAFQYRQRRGGQLEGNQDDFNSQKEESYSRKRTAATLQATWTPLISLEAHRNMQSLESLQSGDIQVTTEEILWALGMQPSLPSQPVQHHLANPISYGDDLAIGRPAATIATQMQRQYETFPPASMPVVADRISSLSFSSMLPSASTRTESTATSLLQAQLSHQAGQFQANMPQDAGHSQYLLQPIAYGQDMYRQQNPLNISNMSAYPVHDPNMQEIVPCGCPIESQVLNAPLSLQIQQSFGRGNETEAGRPVNSFANTNSTEGYMINRQSPTFDSSFNLSLTHSLQQVRSIGLSDSFRMTLLEPQQIYDYLQLPTATNNSSLEPHDLLLDPLPLDVDDNESLRSFDKQDDNVWRNNEPP